MPLNGKGYDNLPVRNFIDFDFYFLASFFIVYTSGIIIYKYIRRFCYSNTIVTILRRIVQSSPSTRWYK